MNRTLPLLATLMFFACVAHATDSKVFRNDAEKVSFRYPSDWEPVTPQSRATLVLLYARDGSLATCNLSAIPSDRPTARQFDADYFLAIYQKIYKDITIKKTSQVESIGQTRAFVEADFTMSLASGEAVAFSTLTMATVHNGKRYMLVLNAPRAALADLRDEFELMASTLMFSTQ